MPAMSKASRRSFIKALVGTTVAVSPATFVGSGVAGAGAAAPAAPGVLPGRTRLIPPSKIGIQLYTVRDKVQSLGFQQVFQQLSEMGYSEVEFAGYTQGTGPITPTQIRTLLNDFGLKATGSHADRNQILTNTQAQCDIANILGMPYLGTGSSPTDNYSKAGYQAAATQWNAAGQNCRNNGLKIYQHNHDREWGFATDDATVRLYDYFLQLTDPELVFMEMDVFWAYVGKNKYPGFEPVQYILDNPTRFPLLHLKDGKATGAPAPANGYDIIEFGAGDIPYRSFLSQLPDRGSRIGIMEQDNAGSTAAGGNPVNSLGNAERSFDRMIGLRA